MTAPTTVDRPARTGSGGTDLLRIAAAVFAVALVIHGADHLRRGMDVITPEVLWLGNLQLVLSAVTIVLVFRGHRWAPGFAIAVGFASAIGFTAAHLLPHWSAFSDSFTGGHHAPGVSTYSWFAACTEIAAGLLLGVAGVVAARRAHV